MTTSFWHGFTNMRSFARASINIVDGDGVWLTDDSGKEYLNAFSSLINLSLGVGQERIVDAITAQARKMPYFTIERATHEAAEKYARQIGRAHV